MCTCVRARVASFAWDGERKNGGEGGQLWEAFALFARGVRLMSRSAFRGGRQLLPLSEKPDGGTGFNPRKSGGMEKKNTRQNRFAEEFCATHRKRMDQTLARGLRTAADAEHVLLRRRCSQLQPACGRERPLLSLLPVF